jgi:cytochrome c553
MDDMYLYKGSTKKLLSQIILVFSLVATGTCSAGDVEAGRIMSAACGGCHGAQGISIAPNYPNLAGQKEKYLVNAINSYRSGDRNDPTMKAMVATLKDADVVNVAAYFASLPGKFNTKAGK